MRLKIFSDVHLEFGPFSVSTDDADVIIAAGDIGVQLSAIEWLQGLEKPVIYVAGNHEYWDGDLLETVQKLRKACQGTNVHFLEQDSVVIDGVRFIGCTLWADFDNGDPFIMSEMSQLMNDFSYITNGSANLTPEDLLAVNQQSAAWLADEIKTHKNDRNIVVTHHAPTLKSWNTPEHEIFCRAYCNDMKKFITKNPVALWVHGHVHDTFDYKVGKTRVVANARGYYDHGLVETFNANNVIEIE